MPTSKDDRRCQRYGGYWNPLYPKREPTWSRNPPKRGNPVALVLGIAVVSLGFWAGDGQSLAICGIWGSILIVVGLFEPPEERKPLSYYRERQRRERPSEYYKYGPGVKDILDRLERCPKCYKAVDPKYPHLCESGNIVGGDSE